MLHPGQTAAWDCERRFPAIISGTQAGKTSFAPWWLWREIQRCGPGDYLAATASYDLFKLKLLPEMRAVFEHVLRKYTYRAFERMLVSRDGETRIILRSASSPGGLESATAKAAIADECGQDDFRLDAWEAIQRRLSLHQGRCLLTTTPYNLGWLKSEIYDRWLAGNPDIQVFTFRSVDNPAFPRAEYERMKAIMPSWKFAMMYDGTFTRPAGLIYESFDDAIHIAQPFEIPLTWPRWVGIDFGAVNTATVWVAEDTEHSAYYVYRDTLEGGMSTVQHAAKALGYAKHERVTGWYGGAPSETQQRMDWHSAGVSVRAPAVSDVEAGIDRGIGLFKQKRLFVFSSCAGLRDELGTYSRIIDADGQITEKIKDKETFHRLDAMRYVLGSLGVRSRLL